MCNIFKKKRKEEIVIAVDGHSSCGKSTLAKDLAKALGYTYVDTGAMYRAITLKIIRERIALDEEASILSMLESTDIIFKRIKGENHLFLDGLDEEKEIRKPSVAALVSPVSEISTIRKFLVDLQRSYGDNKGVVMEGRDITTVVFPEAKLKLFITADIDTRAERRYSEMLSKGIKTSLEEVRKNLSKRDYIDSNRKDSPLTMHPDAILIDTSQHTRESQLQEALQIARKKLMPDAR